MQKKPILTLFRFKSPYMPVRPPLFYVVCSVAHAHSIHGCVRTPSLLLALALHDQGSRLFFN